ncbi:hypothetical protein ACFO25_04585 [Paenactinomyces guangxiensis]|uniref:Uncharacterized protein n=1 Tax=Paenactinomyces guangxiensis TaxID=1490290 RepID=A0A7W2A7K4_9BACL|nr:hypothetical protein [Paenactinomyces guangxiensis]MBA4493655.1 hypothetical protein [Paenactinomyces guangxiensis]MBH8590942.1 hypothetical protein [Paenactinomyces guangxiensis]
MRIRDLSFDLISKQEEGDLFNRDLPSGRRKLFIFILVLFSIVGFSTKYLLIKLGWVGGQTETPKAPSPGSATISADPNQTDQPDGFTSEEIEKAGQTAEAFIRVYTNENQADQGQRLQSLKTFTTSALYEMLKKEIELSRPTGETASASLKKVDEVSCDTNVSSVQCSLKTTLEQKKGQDNPTLIERVYQLTLVQADHKWLVEEVVLRGSFD